MRRIHSYDFHERFRMSRYFYYIYFTLQSFCEENQYFPHFFFVINFGKELLNDSRIISLSFDNEHYALNARLFLTSYLLFSR